MRCHVDGSNGLVEAMLVATEKVVRFFEAVEANGERAQPRVHILGEAFRSHRKPVRDHAPGVAALLDFLAAFLEIGAHQRLAAGNHHDKVFRVDMRFQRIEHLQKIFARHVGDGVLHAVATAVLAVQIAAQRTLPKEIFKRMRLDFVVAIETVCLESKFFLER